MLEKPDISDEHIIACLLNAYGLSVVQISFLTQGADPDTAVYLALASDTAFYFVKLRKGKFELASVQVPKFLNDLGIKQIIPPLTTLTGNLSTNLEMFSVILFPFVEGRNGFEISLSDNNWIEFGKVLKSFHFAVIPLSITRTIKREDYTSKWRKIVKSFLQRIITETFDEPIAADLAEFLRSKRYDTLKLVERSERLALTLRARKPEFILCHGDIHVGNVLIANNGSLFIVDWDTLCFAPKERDLMFVGAGLGGVGHTPQEEISLFYQGYGSTDLDELALTYFRCERIVEDIAVYCKQIFLSEDGGDDRKQSLEFLKSNYLPNGTIELACQSDLVLRSG